MWSAITIADEILKAAKKQSISLTPMQLMKLVYIAHGWSLVVMNRDLFTDRIEAWKYGPVIPNLYQATKRFGRNAIPMNLIDETENPNIDPSVRSFLEDVVRKYGHLSGIQLSNLTHLSGTPWHEVYEPNVMGKEISDDRIRHHYQVKLNEYKQHSTTAAQ